MCRVCPGHPGHRSEAAWVQLLWFISELGVQQCGGCGLWWPLERGGMRALCPSKGSLHWGGAAGAGLGWIQQRVLGKG